jgi:hypothetical protein
MWFHSYLMGGCLIIGAILIATGGLLITRKFTNPDKLRSTHEVGGYLMAIVGTLYSVLLGLIVVDAMGKFQAARDVTEREANCLANVFILSARLPEATRTAIRKGCTDYANAVVDVEWEDMANAQECTNARRLAVNMQEVLMDFEPTTENQKGLYPQMIADTSELWKCRRSRINIATNGLPPVEWVTLIVGALITVFFTFFFEVGQLRVQLVMTAMVAILISLNLFMVLAFGYPFTGDMRLSPTAFQLDQAIFANKLDE